MRKNILVLIVSVLTLSFLNTSYSQSANDYYKSGLSKYKSEKYLEAIKDLKNAIEINAKTNELSNSYLQGTYSLIGCSYSDLGKYKDAISYLTKALELEKNCNDYYTRGICYSELQENDNAVEDYTNAIKLKPDFAFAYTNRGVIYLNLGFREEACQDFKKAIELGDTDAKSMYKKYCK